MVFALNARVVKDMTGLIPDAFQFVVKTKFWLMEYADVLKVYSESMEYVLLAHMVKDTIKCQLDVWIFAVLMKFFQAESVFAHLDFTKLMEFVQLVQKAPITTNPYSDV